MAPRIFSRGDKLEDGHYSVLEEIGVGGMGVVYHCRDELLLRDVAIKMLLPSLMADKKNVDVFREEARLAAQLDHPNIVTVFDIGAEVRNSREHHFVAMEYLPGGNLAARVAQGPLPLEHCLNWMKQLASGLSFAHKRGVVHQDVKADNIFITNEGDLKIGDFGLARLLVGRVYLNSATKGMGTPAYMSPELCRGEQQDHRSDIYSMGILFFEMCTGQLPFRAQGMIEMAMKHTNAPVPSAKRLNPEIPEVLDRVVKRMMAKQPDDRYKSMTDVLGIVDDLIFEMRVARMGLSPRATAQRDNAVPVLATDAELEHSLAQEKQRLSAQKNSSNTVQVEPVVLPPGNPTGKVVKDLQESQAPSSKGIDQEAVKNRDQPLIKKGERGEEVFVTGVPSFVRDTPISSPRAETAAPDTKPDLTQPKLSHEPAIWTFPTHGPIGWAAHPVISRDEKTVYVGSTDGRLYALQSETGTKAFSFDADAPILTSPIYLDGRLVVSDSAGKTQAIDSNTGKVIWSWEGPAPILASPVMAGNQVIVCDRTGQVTALDIRMGRRLWYFSALDAIVAAPRAHGDSLYFGTRGGHVYSIAAHSGKLNWKYVADGRIVSTPTASVDTVYVGTQGGVCFALEAETGRLIWEYPTFSPILKSGVIVFTSVIFASENKWLYCCEKYSGTLKWKAPLKGSPGAALEAIGASVISVSKDGWMQGFDTANGSLRFQRFLHKQIEAPPLIYKDKVYLGTVDGEVSCFNLMV
ncbi:MAG: serine/threonine-protein kinase [Candidatus Melainabacteria bacterium]|nr:serine/threonine-protein kinase [Candidatus Melainabacteria bacterium]